MIEFFLSKQLINEHKMAEYLDTSYFDEKFEIDIENDTMRNLCHVENKYYIPILSGAFSMLYDYAKEHMIHPDDTAFRDLMQPETICARLDMPENCGVLRAECRQKLVDGRYRWVEYVAVKGECHGVPDNKIFFYVFDIQNQKDREDGKASVERITDTHDQTTGLLTSDGFIRAAKEFLSKKASPNLEWCCVAVDIQHYKIFCSWYGKERGNYVLARIGDVLREFENEGNAVCGYFGRDNFAILMQHDRGVINHIYDHIRDIIYSYGKTVGFTPAFGVNILDTSEMIEMSDYDKARIAAEEAKKSYADRIVYFDPKAYHRKRDEYELLTEFQHAMNNGEISFFVQPQCRMSTGKIIGGEALCRWIKPDGTVIAPGRFIPLLEQNGLVTDLDKRLWEAVCKWLRDLIDSGIDPLPVSINVSRIDLISMDVAAYLYALAERYNIPARLLKVEITESAYAENAASVSHAISMLKAKGFIVYMDDFGSGYSSLNMLDKINVDVIKLDMVFMKKDLGINKKGISIIESIISLTKSLEIPVIIEGVEDENQLTFLRSLGCRYAQGYYFYKPMPISDYVALITDKSKIDTTGLRSGKTDIFRTKEFLNENLFSDAVFNNVLGAVAFYSLEGEDLTITRFNESFKTAIADAAMEQRQQNIQNYIVKEDREGVYRALDYAREHIANGSRAEARFYKSDGSVFRFRLRFFFLREDGKKRIYFGQIKDITEQRDQSIRLLEILRTRADVTVCINLDKKIVQYYTGENTLYQDDLPYISLNESVSRTVAARIDNEEEREKFRAYFDADRLKEAYNKAVYYDSFMLNFRLYDEIQPVEFTTYSIRYSKEQDLCVYAFVKGK